jgi:predicted transcriptional regulator
MRLRKALAANLKRIRLAAKLSQEELAHRADMDRTYVSSLERWSASPMRLASNQSNCCALRTRRLSEI